jgi:hypothetical protein
VIVQVHHLIEDYVVRKQYGVVCGRLLAICTTYRHVPVVAKSVSYLRLVRLAARIRTAFRRIWYSMTSWKSVVELQIWLKLDRSVGHGTWRREYVLMLRATQIRTQKHFLQHSCCYSIYSDVRLISTHTYKQWIVTFFLGKCGYANAQQCWVVRTLPHVFPCIAAIRLLLHRC